MELIKNVVNAAKRKSAENKRAKELAAKYQAEKKIKEKIANAPAPTKKKNVPSLGNTISAVKKRNKILSDL